MPALRDTLLHLRPRSWPIVLAHYAGGAAIALAHDTRPSGANWITALAGGAIWTVCLNGGTLALNSAYDQDNGGDIGYLDNPPPVPPNLARVSALLMVAGIGLSLALAPVAGLGFYHVYVAAFILSFLYSVPPLRFKAIAGADLVINMVGYGALTFAAGALASGLGHSASPEGSHFDPGTAAGVAWLAVGFGFLFGAFYPMTQIYQMPTDAAKGDRTLAVRLGARRSLAFSIALIVLCGISQGIAAYMMGLRLWGWIGVIGASGAWIIFTIDWLRRTEGYPSKKGMYRALSLWAVSDVLVILAFAFGTRAV